MNLTTKIGPYGQASKINKNAYFFYGGTLGAYSGEAFLINIKERKLERLKSGSSRCTGASTFKDDKIYIFGGSSTGSDKLNSCKTYDLKQNKWKSINSLPVPCFQMMAAVVDDVIILSGAQIDCCYSYNDSAFSNILKLPSGLGKIVCEGWIFCKSILYENKDENLDNWVSHHVENTWNYPLLVSTTFKRGQYFYFIDKEDSLMRIDTELKRFEKIDYFRRDNSYCVMY